MRGEGGHKFENLFQFHSQMFHRAPEYMRKFRTWKMQEDGLREDNGCVTGKSIWLGAGHLRWRLPRMPSAVRGGGKGLLWIMFGLHRTV